MIGLLVECDGCGAQASLPVDRDGVILAKDSTLCLDTPFMEQPDGWSIAEHRQHCPACGPVPRGARRFPPAEDEIEGAPV